MCVVYHDVEGSEITHLAVTVCWSGQPVQQWSGQWSEQVVLVKDGHVLAWWIVGEVVYMRMCLTARCNCRITISTYSMTPDRTVDGKYAVLTSMCTLHTQKCVPSSPNKQPPPSALNMTLPAFAAERRRTCSMVPAATDGYLLQKPAHTHTHV